MKINTKFLTAEIILEKGENVKIKSKNQDGFVRIFYADFLKKKREWSNENQNKTQKK